MKLREKCCNRLKGGHKAAIKIRLNSGDVNRLIISVHELHVSQNFEQIVQTVLDKNVG